MGNLGLVQCSNGDEVGVPKIVLFEAVIQILVTEMDAHKPQQMTVL